MLKEESEGRKGRRDRWGCVCVWRKKVLPVLVPRVIITQSNTFSGTSLSTDTSLARNIRKALLRMDTLGLFGFRSVILPEPYFISIFQVVVLKWGNLLLSSIHPSNNVLKYLQHTWEVLDFSLCFALGLLLMLPPLLFWDSWPSDMCSQKVLKWCKYEFAEGSTDSLYLQVNNFVLLIKVSQINSQSI